MSQHHFHTWLNLISTEIHSSALTFKVLVTHSPKNSVGPSMQHTTTRCTCCEKRSHYSMLKHQLATSLQLFSATPQVHISLGMYTHYLVPTHPSFTHPSLPEIQKLKWNTQDLAKQGRADEGPTLLWPNFQKAWRLPLGKISSILEDPCWALCAWQCSSKYTTKIRAGFYKKAASSK